MSRNSAAYPRCYDALEVEVAVVGVRVRFEALRPLFCSGACAGGRQPISRVVGVVWLPSLSYSVF
jgi:hypothetical protein